MCCSSLRFFKRYIHIILILYDLDEQKKSSKKDQSDKEEIDSPFFNSAQYLRAGPPCGKKIQISPSAKPASPVRLQQKHSTRSESRATRPKRLKHSPSPAQNEDIGELLKIIVHKSMLVVPVSKCSD